MSKSSLKKQLKVQSCSEILADNDRMSISYQSFVLCKPASDWSVTFALNKFPIAFLHPRAFRKLLCLFWKMWTSGCGCSLFPGPRAILRLLLVLYLDWLGATLRNAQPAFLHISRNDVVPKLERFRGKQWKVGLVQGAHSRLSCHRLFPSQTVIYIRVSDYTAALVNLKNTHTHTEMKTKQPTQRPTARTRLNFW